MKELLFLAKRLDQVQMPFTFSLKKGGLKIIEKKAMDKDAILCFFNYLQERLQNLDYFHLAINHRHCIQKLINFARGVVHSKNDPIFESILLKLSIGSNLELKEFATFKKIVQVNRLDDTMLSLGKKLISDGSFEVYFPVRIENIERWIPITQIKYQKKEQVIKAFFKERLLFELNEDYTFSDDYIFTHEGLRKHNIYTSQEILPYDMQDPKQWQNKHVLEVYTISQRKKRPSMIFNNHAYLVLKDEKGLVRSIGQDILVYFREPKYLQAFSYKRGQGLITTPDTSVFESSFLRNFSKVSFTITKKEHNKILEIVKRDKNNLDRLASLLRGNCASYVARLLRLGARIEVDPFMSATHIFLKHFLIPRFYKPFKKTHYLPKWLRRSFFYLPPIYFLQFVIGICSLTMSNKSLKRKRDFSIFDLFLRPYKIGADHPLRLIRELEKKKGQ